MCGITGLVDLRSERQVNEQLLRAMNDSLLHRGPDGEGFHLEAGVGFGHRRLSIIDLEGGKQPLYNEDKTVIVTFNGEIFNFMEVEKELLSLGHIFRTRCDTEVIVHAWEEWGVECLKRFNGMFSFAIWDRNKRTLFIARDRLGVKPLFYAEVDGWLVFGSELKAVLQHPGIPRDIDPTAVEDYFTFGYVPDPKTIYRSIKKLEPGTYICLQRGQPIKVNRYWDVPLMGKRDAAVDFSGIQQELRDRLKEAVRKRMVADVPLGAFLSGGIDSSAVVAMMRELGDNKILTCSIGFKEAQYDESLYSKMVADVKHTDHKAETVDSSDYSLLDKLVGIYDEPYADSSAIPTYRVCELARKYVTVALSGDGGDESFIGYRRYRLMAMEESLRSKVPLALRQAIFGPLGRWYPKLDWAPRMFRAKTTLQALARTTVDAYLHGISLSSDEMRGRLFSAQFKRQLQGYSSREVFHDHIKDKNFEDGLSMAQYLDFKTYLPGDILTKVDRASMAHSLEVRTPFLDYEFVEWASSLPTDLKLHHGTGKYVLKESLRKILPDEILFRKKMGFSVPIDVWFRGSLNEHIRIAMQAPHLRDSGIFDANLLDLILRQHVSGQRNHSATLWSLLMFEGFMRGQAVA